MSRPIRPLLLASALAAVAALSLTACGNDGVAVESKEHTVSSGVNGVAGPVKILNAQLTLGLEGGGLLGVAFYNGGGSADQLVAVTGPQGTSFTFPTGVTGYPGAYAGESATPSQTLDPASTAPSSPSSRPRSSVSASPVAEQAPTSIDLPADTGVFLNAGLTQIAVSGLPDDAAVGQSEPITFTFVGAGSVTLSVPITGAPQVGGSSTPLPAVSDAGAADGPDSSTPAPPVTVTAPASTVTATATVTATRPAGAPTTTAP